MIICPFLINSGMVGGCGAAGAVICPMSFTMDFGISERRLGLHRGFHSRFSGILAMVPPRPASSRQRQWHKVKTLMAPLQTLRAS